MQSRFLFRLFSYISKCKGRNCFPEQAPGLSCIPIYVPAPWFSWSERISEWESKYRLPATMIVIISFLLLFKSNNYNYFILYAVVQPPTYLVIMYFVLCVFHYFNNLILLEKGARACRIFSLVKWFLSLILKNKVINWKYIIWVSI